MLRITAGRSVAGGRLDETNFVKWPLKIALWGISGTSTGNQKPSQGAHLPVVMQMHYRRRGMQARKECPMATQISEAESRLTDRYQTTVPESVRRALGLGKRDTLVYTLLDDGSVQLSRANDDPALAPFLALLTDDIALHPENLQSIPDTLLRRIDDLIGDMDVDLDAPLDEDE